MLWKIKETFRLLFSLELYEEIFDEEKLQEKEFKKQLKAKFDKFKDDLRGNTRLRQDGQEE